MNTIIFVLSWLILPGMLFWFWNSYYPKSHIFYNCHQIVWIPFILNLSSICYLLNIKNKSRLIISLVCCIALCLLHKRIFYPSCGLYILKRGFLWKKHKIPFKNGWEDKRWGKRAAEVRKIVKLLQSAPLASVKALFLPFPPPQYTLFTAQHSQTYHTASYPHQKSNQHN